MIVYPKNWETIGSEITIKQIEDTILQILEEIQCPCLSLSGGIDSSLILYYMIQVYGKEKIKCFTMALNSEHPDYIFSNMISEYFEIDNELFVPLKTIEDDGLGNNIVKTFYEYLSKRKVSRIIACDGIDEFMGGYYAHQAIPDENTYYYFLRNLYDKQLKPLNKNSNNVEVILPYIDSRLVNLLSQIPLRDKVDTDNRKKIMQRMARGKIPENIIDRRKYGFCDAMRIKK